MPFVLGAEVGVGEGRVPERRAPIFEARSLASPVLKQRVPAGRLTTSLAISGVPNAMASLTEVASPSENVDRTKILEPAITARQDSWVTSPNAKIYSGSPSGLFSLSPITTQPKRGCF